MKKLVFIFLVLSNAVFSQQSDFIPANDLFEGLQPGDTHLMINPLNAPFKCIDQKVLELGNGRQLISLKYSDGPSLDTLLSSELRAVNKNTIVSVEVGRSGNKPPTEMLAGTYDTLYVDLGSNYFIYNMFLFKPDFVSNVSEWITPGFGYIVLEHDTYDILAQMMDFSNIYHVFLEDYVFDGPDTLYFDSSEAAYEVSLQPMDVNGDPLPRDNYMDDELSMLYQTENGYFAGISVSATASLDMHFYFSDFNDQFEPYFANRYCNPLGENEIYYVDYKGMDNGIDQDTILSNDYQDYFHSKVNMKLAEHEEFHLENYFALEKKIKYFNMSGKFHASGAMLIVYRKIPPNKYWNGTLHLDQYGNTNYTSGPYVVLFAGREGYDEEYYLRTTAFDTNNDSISNFLTFYPYADIAAAGTDDTIFSASGTSIPWLRWKNYSGELNFDGGWFGASHEMIFPFFNSQTYEIYDANGNLVDAAPGSSYYSIVTTGTYSVKLKNAHNDFDGIFGTSEAWFEFNTGLQDSRPPTLRPIQFRDQNNKVRHHFSFSDEVNLVFAAADFSYYDLFYQGIDFHPVDTKLTEVRLREHNETEWQVLGAGEVYQDSLIGTLYSTALTDYITDDSALYDVQIEIHDLSGNSATYTFSPAFVIADHVVSVADHHLNTEADISCSPNPASARVNFEPEDGNKIASIHIFNANGKPVFSKETLPKQSWSVDVSRFKSGIYYFKVKTLQGHISTGKFVVSR